MKVTGLCLVSARECLSDLDWSTELSGQSLLARALDTLAATPNVDERLVLTDQSKLAQLGCVEDVAVRLVPGWFFDFKLAFYSKEHWLLSRAASALTEAGACGDVLVHLDWRNPLVTARTLEKMYHGLLDDRVAARTVGVYPVDPNLFAKLSHMEEKFFPVWADPGADRQMIPQLYRTMETGVVHVARMLMPIPETKGITLSREEGLTLQCLEHLELAAFYLDRRSRLGGNDS